MSTQQGTPGGYAFRSLMVLLSEDQLIWDQRGDTIF
jgi:hypothetical protein